MNYRKDRYGNELSILGYGCMRFSRNAGKTDIKKAEREIMLAYEKEAIEDILTNFEKLDFKGGVLYANGEICAFTVSEQLTKDMAVIHIEKANTDFNGAFAAINQMNLENTWSHLKYVNREEDLGIEGLKKAKKSYRPCRMIDKYKAVKVK